MQSLRSFASLLAVALVASLLAGPARAQDDGTTNAPTPGRTAPGVHPPRKGPGGVRPLVHSNPNAAPFGPANGGNAGNGAPPLAPAAPSNRPSIAPDGSRIITPSPAALARRGGGPPSPEPGNKKEAGANAKLWSLSFDKRDLAEVIQEVANITQRNFILPERVSGKITILTNTPVPAEEVWSVFLAALDANNWAVYPIGHYWKLSEKKQSSRANIPTYLEPGEEPAANEQMVTKLFKLHYVDADQMRNTINQFTTRDSDFQIFPPDTLIISDLGINMRRLQRLIETLDQPGGSEEIHIVQAQYGTAAELATKLTEIFAAQATKSPGGQRQFGVAEGNAPPGAGAPGNPNNAAAGGSGSGPLNVSKVIAEDRTNKLIIIAGAKSFQRVLDLLRQIDVPGGENGVHVYYLDNAKAEDVATTMQSLAQGVSGKKKAGVGAAPGAPSGANAASGGADLFTGDVKITADKNTNSLVIVASTSDYRNVLKVIQQLDIPRRQVFVEAVIMEISLEDDLNVGASLHGGKLVNNGTTQVPLVFGSELGSLNSLGGVSSLASLNGFLAGLQGAPFTIPGTSVSIPSFAVLVNALQSSSDVNVVSTPTITMTDNSEGEITVGQNVPFQAGYSPSSSALSSLTSSSSTATSSLVGSTLGLGGLSSLYAPIQRQNVELRLKIKPQINQGDYVRLEIDEQTEQIASTDPTLGPTTSKRSAKTTLLAKDQETVIIGGLIQEQTIKGSSKTPILGSIPVLGWLFRSDTSKKIKSNILLFLTPYIIRDQSDYRRIFERKIAERAEFVKRFTGADSNYVAAIDYGRKASPLARLSRTVDLEMNRVENGGPGISGERLIQPSGAIPPPRFAPPVVNPARPSEPVIQQSWPPAPGGAPTPAATKPATSGEPGSKPPSETQAAEPGGVIAEPAAPVVPVTPPTNEPGSTPPDVGPDERTPPSGVIRPGTSTDTK